MTVTDYADEVAVIVAVRKARLPKDADGDGWIDEGKPTERYIGTGTAQARSALRRGAKLVKPTPKKAAPKKATKPVSKPKAQRTAEYNDLMGTGRSGRTTSTTQQRAAYMAAQARAAKAHQKQHPPKTRADWDAQYAVAHEAGMEAAKKAGWKATAPKKAAPKPAPKKAAPKAAPKKRATPERSTTLPRGVNPAKDKTNPLFAPLFRPVKATGSNDYQKFKREHDKRVADQKAVGAMKAGGKTHFRRFLPMEHGKVAQPIAPPGGKYVAGGPMTLNEPGVMGETLLQYNPTLNKLVSDYFGAQLSESEGMSSKHGRVPNSVFDFYAGGFGVELKTIAVTGSHGKYKVPHMKEKLATARKRGIKPAVVFMMVDQKNGRVWLFGAKGPNLSESGNHTYSTMDMIGPAEGIPISQDAMYSAWLYGHVDRPLREGGDGNSVKGNGTKVTITGKPSKTRYGSESTKKTVEQMLSEPAVGTFR